MSGATLLDVTRMAAWCWSGRPPTGLDRVCRAYARHFAHDARAVIQIAGRARALDRDRSARLFEAFEGSLGSFRKTLVRVLAMPQSGRSVDERAVYLNVGHSGFDRAAHWRAVEGMTAKRVYLLHDLIPITHPQLTTPHKAARHRERVCKALARADGIVTNSHATAGDLVAFAQEQGLTPPPILAAPIAAQPLPRVGEAPASSRPYFLCIGTIEPRKNHALLLRVWQRLIERMGEDTPHLILAGKRGIGASAILSSLREDPRLQRFVAVRPGLSDKELGTLLDGGRALLFPTLAEGFGLPVVEALQAGVPVIASDLPALREGSQGIATLLDPADEDAWLDAICNHCGEGVDRARQLAAIARFRTPTWADHFEAVEEWLAKLPARRLDRREGGGAGRTPMGNGTQDRAWQC